MRVVWSEESAACKDGFSWPSSAGVPEMRAVKAESAARPASPLAWRGDLQRVSARKRRDWFAL